MKSRLVGTSLILAALGVAAVSVAGPLVGKAGPAAAGKACPIGVLGAAEKGLEEPAAKAPVDPVATAILKRLSEVPPGQAVLIFTRDGKSRVAYPPAGIKDLPLVEGQVMLSHTPASLQKEGIYEHVKPGDVTAIYNWPLLKGLDVADPSGAWYLVKKGEAKYRGTLSGISPDGKLIFVATGMRQPVLLDPAAYVRAERVEPVQAPVARVPAPVGAAPVVAARVVAIAPAKVIPIAEPPSLSQRLEQVGPDQHVTLKANGLPPAVGRIVGFDSKGNVRFISDNGEHEVTLPRLMITDVAVTPAARVPASVPAAVRPPAPVVKLPPPPGASATAAERQAWVKKMFEGQSSYREEKTEFLAVVKFPDGVRQRFFYHLADRRYAEQAGLIFDNARLSDLPRGQSYTFVITDQGEKSFGKVNDEWEYGVKHINLANQRNVAVAGEVYIDPRGNFVFNFQSGAFMEKRVKSGEIDQAQLRARVQAVFQSEMPGAQGRFTEGKLLSDATPSRKAIALLCKSPLFVGVKMNAHNCKEMGF